MAETQEKEATETELLVSTLRRMPAVPSTRLMLERIRRGLVQQVRAIDDYLQELPKC